MQRPSHKSQNARQSFWASLMLLCFGLGVLAFLVTIERVNWFQIKPASGTAAAMAKASEKATANVTSAMARPADTGTANVR